MIKQTWEINSEERKRILNLHESATKNLYLVVEQSPTTTGGKMVTPGIPAKTESSTYPETNIGNFFKMGEYESDLVKQQILNLRPNIEEFMKNSDAQKFNISITAGESQIKNPKAFETKGSLALARANSVKTYFEENFKDLIDKGILTINSPANTEEVSIGQTEYKANSADPDNVNHKFYLDNKPKYDSEQFVKFTLKGEGTKATLAVPPTYICDFKTEARGGVSYKENNFLYSAFTIDISSMPNGSKFDVSFKPEFVPDMMICSTQSETKSTGFIGELWWADKLATILGNAFGANVPAPLPSNIVPVDTKTMLAYYENGDGTQAKNFKDWFQHTLDYVDYSKSPKNIIKQIKWWRFDGNIPIDSKCRPDSTAVGDNRYWTGNIGKTLNFTKNSGDTSLTIYVYSPIGSTVWRIMGGCEGTQGK